MKSIVLLTILSAAWHGSNQLVSAKDSSTYFGGTDNDGYVAWLAGKTYARSAFVESTQQEGAGVAVHWTILNGETIQLAVVAKATGWVGFGIGESGSMLGADIVLFSAENSALVDSYVLDQSIMPMADACQSWTLLDSTVTDGFIIFEASRLLNTGDSQDRILADDSETSTPPTRVLAAWGDSTQPSFHGDGNARSTIRFHGNSADAPNEAESFVRTMDSDAQGNFSLLAGSYVIPTNRTTYKTFCFSSDYLLSMNVDLAQSLHTIGIEAIIDPRTKPFVHHFVLAGSLQSNDDNVPCDEYGSVEMAYAWAPGDVPLNLPPHIGSPLGLGGYQSFVLKIHYDNPNGVANMADSSGIRMYYSNQRREFDMGVFSMGDIPNPA